LKLLGFTVSFAGFAGGGGGGQASELLPRIEKAKTKAR
jgi:hypothetical protein